jgi:hypothetical protein
VSISLIHDPGSPGLDPYLFLIGPDGFQVAQDDDGNPNNDSRIPTNAGTIALPLTGKYVIEVTSFLGGQTGDYTVTVMPSGCTLSVNQTSQHFDAGGGSAVINVTATGSNCAEFYQVVKTPNSANWLTTQVSGGPGSQQITLNATANGTTVGRRAFIAIAPFVNVSGTVFGGLRIPVTQSGTGPNCSETPISIGQTVNGNLAVSDCESPIKGLNTQGVGFRAARYTFAASAGQPISINLTSFQFDTFVTLIGPNGNILLTDDDSGGGTNSRIPGGSGMLTLGLSGTHTIEVSSFGVQQTGAYSLTLDGTADGPATIQLSQANYNIGEGASFLTCTATRSGNA